MTNTLFINLLLAAFHQTSITDNWIRRVKDYLIKVVREAKVKSNWELLTKNMKTSALILLNEFYENRIRFFPLFYPSFKT